MPDAFDTLASKYAAFVEKRDWEQFHTPQNLAMALSIEANELLEEFLWFNNPDAETVAADDALMENVREELADVVIYAIGMANQLDIDLMDAVDEKMEQNEARFDEESAAEITDELEQWQ